MRFLITLLLFSLLTFSCQDKGKEKAPSQSDSLAHDPPPADPEIFSNETFKEVRVSPTGPGAYRVTGKARVFEATFNYVVEDGHQELLKGYEMTDEGAPAFGNFDFVIDSITKKPNTSLSLILFESSPKDGSRQWELIIPLN